MKELSLLHSVSANTLSSSRPNTSCGAGSSSLADEVRKLASGAPPNEC